MSELSIEARALSKHYGHLVAVDLVFMGAAEISRHNLVYVHSRLPIAYFRLFSLCRNSPQWEVRITTMFRAGTMGV